MKEKKMYPIAVGYDKWQSKEIIKYFTDYYGDICYPVEQTTKELSSPLKIYKSKIQLGKILFDDPVSTWCHSNVVVKYDANKNVFPNKAKAKNKIDVFASQLDAFVIYEKKKDELSYYFN